MKKIIIFIILIICIYSCQRNLTPLEQELEKVKQSWTEEQIENFSKKQIEIALQESHFEYGLYIRNEYLRNPKDSILFKYFRSLKIDHIDHMSGVFLTSLHRNLNNKPIDLDGQLEAIYELQERQKLLDSNNTKRAIKYYTNYKIGDTIIIRRPINRNNNATQYSYPENSGWTYNDNLDLLIKGVLIEKEQLIDTFNMLFRVKVLSMNKPNSKVLMERVLPGDVIEGDFRLDIIEIGNNSNDNDIN